jgi:hypothetical protein
MMGWPGSSFPRGSLLGLVLSVTMGIADSAAGMRQAGEATSFEMTLREGKLTARIAAFPLRHVMDELGRLSGAEVRWLDQQEDAEVSVQFSDLSLEKALARILENNFLLVYPSSAEERPLPAEIWLWSRWREATAVREVRPAAPVQKNLMREERGEPDMDGAIDLTAQPRSVRLEAVHLLAMDAGEDEDARAILFHLADNDSDPRVREAASKVLERVK